MTRRILFSLLMVMLTICPIPTVMAEDIGEIENLEEITPEQDEPVISYKYLILKISGPQIWGLMIVCIATRRIKRKGSARMLLRIHKTCGFTALVVATLHGVVSFLW